MTNTMRAGSSFLTRILSAHNQVAISYDSLNFFRYIHNRYGNVHLEQNFRKLIEDTAFRLENRFGISVNVDSCIRDAEVQGFSYSSAYWVLLKSIFSEHVKCTFNEAPVKTYERCLIKSNTDYNDRLYPSVACIVGMYLFVCFICILA